jgi:hypothetical protein
MAAPAADANAQRVEGRIRGLHAPAYVAVLDETYAVASEGQTNADGAFNLQLPPDATPHLLAVQPDDPVGDHGIGVYRCQPRVFALRRAPRESGALHVDVELPPSGALILRGRDAKGAILRWAEWERRGTFGGVFAYASDLDHEASPGVVWPVYDAGSRREGAAREKGLPAIHLPPGGPYVVHVLYWQTDGYGRLHLRMDNAGRGYQIDGAGASVLLDVNWELAGTAVADLARRSQEWPALTRLEAAALEQQMERALSSENDEARAKAADAVLVAALEARDRLELAAARERIPSVRQGRIALRVRDAGGGPVAGARLQVTQEEHGFLLGAFDGGEFDAAPWRAAREAGFNLATVLAGWGWSDAAAGADLAMQAQAAGLPQLREMGFATKVHGAVWMQDYGILPQRAMKLPARAAASANLEQLRALVRAWRDEGNLWEVVNEPATTNIAGLSRPEMAKLMSEAAAIVREAEAGRTLVNSPHESDYGRKHLIFNLDGRPADGFPETYISFLQRAEASEALDGIDVIGLQFYPGAHLNEETFGGVLAPAAPPSHLLDLVALYSRFGRPIHITEFSLPASCANPERAGWWRKPWDEAVQAEYAEAVLTLAMAAPQVESLTWWDVAAEGSSVVDGSLLRADGSPRPVLERIRECLRRWTTSFEGQTDAEGEAACDAFWGRHRIRVELPDGRSLERQVDVLPGETAAVEFGAENN